jgi:hypothetical protein
MSAARIGEDHRGCAAKAIKTASASRPPSPKGEPREEGQSDVAVKAGASAPPLVADLVAALIALQRTRRFAIKMQSRLDRACDSFLARDLFGYIPPRKKTDRSTAEAKAGKKIFAQVAATRRMVETGGQDPGTIAEKGPGGDVLSASSRRIIVHTAESRAVWDGLRAEAEKAMEATAKQLPCEPFRASVRGLGLLGVAIIVGEAGDLASYPTKSHLWKRLGLAVIDGERQQRKSDPEKAAAHGYSPQRRAEMWTLGDSLMRSQWAGDKDANGDDPKKSGLPIAVPAHPRGPYGETYQRRRIITADRDDWTPGRQNADAKRVAFKRLISHLRAAWRATESDADHRIYAEKAGDRTSASPFVPALAAD